MIGASFAVLLVFACVGEDPDTVIVINNDGGSPDTVANDQLAVDVASTDDVAPDVAKTGCPDPNTPATLVFTTALELSPSFGGLPGADQKCAEAAIDGGLSGTFRAWISSDGTSAASRIIDPDPTRPIRLVGDGGAIVVACAAKLVGGTLAHAIDQNQRADTVAPNTQVWTGTFADGGLAPDGGCRDWTVGNGGTYAGIIGDPHVTGPTWTEKAPKDCGGTARLFCFQVP